MKEWIYIFQLKNVISYCFYLINHYSNNNNISNGNRSSSSGQCLCREVNSYKVIDYCMKWCGVGSGFALFSIANHLSKAMNSLPADSLVWSDHDHHHHHHQSKIDITQFTFARSRRYSFFVSRLFQSNCGSRNINSTRIIIMQLFIWLPCWINFHSIKNRKWGNIVTNWWSWEFGCSSESMGVRFRCSTDIMECASTDVPLNLS